MMNTMNDPFGTNNITSILDDGTTDTIDWDKLTITPGGISPNITWASQGISIGVEQQNSLTVTGDASIGGDLKVTGDIDVGGGSLGARIDRIEARLAILRIRPDLEERWQQLRELGDQYRQLEAELIERDFIFEQLKK